MVKKESKEHSNLSELFRNSESIEDKVKKALKGLIRVYNYKIEDSEVHIWSKTDAFNISNVLIRNMLKYGFKIKLVTISNDKVKVNLFGGGYTHKPMIIFKEVF